MEQPTREELRDRTTEAFDRMTSFGELLLPLAGCVRGIVEDYEELVEQPPEELFLAAAYLRGLIDIAVGDEPEEGYRMALARLQP